MSKSNRSFNEKVVNGIFGVSMATTVLGMSALVGFSVRHHLNQQKADNIAKEVTNTSEYATYETSVQDENRALLNEGKIDRETYELRNNVDTIVNNYLKSTTNEDVLEQKEEYLDAKDKQNFAGGACGVGAAIMVGGVFGLGAWNVIKDKVKEDEQDSEMSM